MSAKILTLCGSTREGSYSRMLLKIAADAAREAGADVTDADLRDYAMPFYNADLEAAEGLPDKAAALRTLFQSHDGLLLGTTEYNGGVSAELKNAIDWVSRPYGDSPNYAAIAGKTVAIVSASAGMLGGARAQIAWRTSFQVMQCVLVPQTANLPFCQNAFNDDGSLKDDNIAGMVKLVGQKMVELMNARH